MRHQKFFMVVFLAACVACPPRCCPSSAAISSRRVDAGQFKLHVRAKTGTRIEEMARLCDLVEAEIRRIIPARELATIIDNIGLPLSGTNMSYNMSGTLGPADADILVSLNSGHAPTEHYMKLLREQLPAKFPGMTFYFLPADIVSQILNFGLPAPIDVQVVGRNIEANRAFALSLYQKLRAGRRHRRPARAAALRPAQLDINVDRTRAQQAGFSQKDVAQEPADRAVRAASRPTRRSG